MTRTGPFRWTEITSSRAANRGVATGRLLLILGAVEDPLHLMSCFERGMVFASLGGLESALEDFERVSSAELAPDDFKAIAYSNQAWVLEVLGQCAESLAAADCSLALKSGKYAPQEQGVRAARPGAPAGGPGELQGGAPHRPALGWGPRWRSPPKGRGLRAERRWWQGGPGAGALLACLGYAPCVGIVFSLVGVAASLFANHIEAKERARELERQLEGARELLSRLVQADPTMTRDLEAGFRDVTAAVHDTYRLLEKVGQQEQLEEGLLGCRQAQAPRGGVREDGPGALALFPPGHQETVGALAEALAVMRDSLPLDLLRTASIPRAELVLGEERLKVDGYAEVYEASWGGAPVAVKRFLLNDYTED
jgi:hypothetical protein